MYWDYPLDEITDLVRSLVDMDMDERPVAIIDDRFYELPADWRKLAKDNNISDFKYLSVVSMDEKEYKTIMKKTKDDVQDLLFGYIEPEKIGELYKALLSGENNYKERTLAEVDGRLFELPKDWKEIYRDVKSKSNIKNENIEGGKNINFHYSFNDRAKLESIVNRMKFVDKEFGFEINPFFMEFRLNVCNIVWKEFKDLPSNISLIVNAETKEEAILTAIKKIEKEYGDTILEADIVIEPPIRAMENEKSLAHERRARKNDEMER